MLCSIVKWMVSSALDERRQVSGFAKRHISKCASCRAFYLDSVSMAKRLSEDAVAFKETPSFLQERRASAPSRSFKIPALAGGALALLLVAGGVFFMAGPQRGSLEASSKSVAAATEGIVILARPVERISDGSFVLPDLDVDSGLESLASDAKSAVKFILASASL